MFSFVQPQHSRSSLLPQHGWTWWYTLQECYLAELNVGGNVCDNTQVVQEATFSQSLLACLYQIKLCPFSHRYNAFGIVSLTLLMTFELHLTYRRPFIPIMKFLVFVYSTPCQQRVTEFAKKLKTIGQNQNICDVSAVTFLSFSNAYNTMAVSVCMFLFNLQHEVNNLAR